MTQPEKPSPVTVGGKESGNPQSASAATFGAPVLNNVPGSRRGIVVLTEAFKDPVEAARVMIEATVGRRSISPCA